jgi:two-component system phosphate regulon response regulator PhoB
METKGSILIVEDEPAIRFALKYELSQNGYQFLTAEDISQAFLIIDSDKPDLIILDVMLPGGRDEGFKLCRRLKADEATRSIPIIILTARPAQDEVTAKNAGADRYFTKPPNMLELKEAIRDLLAEAQAK